MESLRKDPEASARVGTLGSKYLEDAPKLDKPAKFDIDDYVSECMYGDIMGKYKTQSWNEDSTILGASIRGVIIVENLKRS